MCEGPTFRIAPRAIADLNHALAWSRDQFGDVQAMHYARLLDRKIAMIVAFPEIGRARPDLYPGLRSFPSGKHIIFSVVQELVVILRIAHQRQQLDDLWFEE